MLQWADLDEIGLLLARADPRLLVAALAMYGADLALRALRWHMLMADTNRLTYREVLIALVVGYAVNNVLPARLGEVFRADFCKRRYGVSGTYALGSILLERLLDGAMVLGILTIGFLLLDEAGTAADTIRGLLLAGGVLGAAGLALVWLVGGGHVRRRIPALRWVSARLEFLEASFQVVATGAFYRGALVSVPVWALESMAIWLVLRALGISLEWAPLLCLVGVASLSTLLPSAPAYMGSYHAAYALILVLAGSTVSAGVAAATSVQLFLLAPVTLIGLLTLLYVSLAPSLERRA